VQDFEDEDIENSEEENFIEEEFERRKRKKPSDVEALAKFDLKESRLVFRMVRERARRERLRLRERSRIDYVL